MTQGIDEQSLEERVARESTGMVERLRTATRINMPYEHGERHRVVGFVLPEEIAWPRDGTAYDILDELIAAIHDQDGLREALDDPQLPFAVALAVQNSHYVASGLEAKDELDAFTEQYVKDARTSIEVIRAALKGGAR